MSFGDKAEPLVKLGFHVVPAHKNKKRSFLKKWPEIATTNPKQIEYWDRTFPDANVVIACGERSDLSVVDVDVKGDVDGNIALIEHRDAGRVLPPRPMVRSPSGGLHLYFKHQPGLSNAQGISKTGRGLGVGIDYRTSGGGICGAGSVTEQGAYTWIGEAPTTPESIPYLSPWAIKALRVKPTAKREPPEGIAGEFGGILHTLSKAVNSQRNGCVFWAAKRFADEGAKMDDWKMFRAVCESIAPPEPVADFWWQCLNTIRSAMNNPRFTV